MGFDIFSQPTGPNISISLFGDAAQAGAKLGEEIPTQLTSAIRGAQEGYKYGLDTTAESQQNALRQNQVNRIDVANQQQDAQLQIQQAQARIQQTAASRDETNAAIQTTTEADKLQEEDTQAKQTNAILQQRDAFITDFEKKTPSDQWDAYSSGANFNVLRDPATRKAVLEQLSNNPFVQSNPQYISQVNRDLGHASIDDYYLKKAQADTEKYQNARNEALYGDGSSITNLISDKLHVPRENAIDSVDIVDSGTFMKDPNNPNQLALDANGKRITATADYLKNNPSPKGSYEVISNRPDSNGQVITTVMPSKAGEAYNTAKAYKREADGTMASWAKNYQEQNNKAAQNNVNGANPPSGGINGRDVVPFKETLKTQLGLSDDTINHIGRPIVDLNSQLWSYVHKPELRTDPAALTRLGNTVGTISRAVTDKTFDDSPAIQTQYNQDKVDKYNKGVDATLDAPIFQMLPQSIKDRYQKLLNVYKVDSPKDLYAHDNAGPVQAQLHRIINDVMTATQAAQTQPFKASGAIQGQGAYYTSGAAGAPTS